MKYYTCLYCFNEFEPTRRRVQKYCSNTCRSKAHHARKTISNKPKLENKNLTNIETSSTPTITKIDSMSTSGVANAAVGNVIAGGIKSFFTAEKNKPATKGDINDLITLIKKRYLPIQNMPMNQHGEFPYYDVETKNVVYLSQK